jgi:hypothetical protein
MSMKNKPHLKYLLFVIVVALWLVLVLTAAGATSLPPQFVRAIHQVETGGKLGAIYGDGKLALGPLQIHRAYWKDSGVKGSYEQCADYDYSVRVMTAYLHRYERKALLTGNLEALARAHNGGPGWRAKPRLTDAYWGKVQLKLPSSGRK